MKKFFAVIPLVLLLTTFAVQAKKLAGQIILADDTIDVTFKIPVKFVAQEPDYESLQFAIKYYGPSGNKKKIYPEDAREIRFTFQNDTIRLLSCHNTEKVGDLLNKTPQMFLKLEVDGAARLFRYFYTLKSPSPTNNGGMYSKNMENLIIKRSGQAMITVKGLSFRNDLKDYFADCPELVTKLDNRDFRKRDVMEVVRFYNEKCE